LYRIKILSTLFIIVFSISCFSQNLEKKVDSLSWMSSGEQYGDKIPTAYRILQIDPSNFSAHRYIVSSYVSLNQFNKAYSYIDSILALPVLNEDVYLALTYGLIHMAPYDSIYDEYYFKILRLCLTNKNTIADASYFLSDAFYSDFILPTKKSPPTWWQFGLDGIDKLKTDSIVANMMQISVDSLRSINNNHKEPEPLKSVYNNAADSALKYLEILTASNSVYNRVAKLPIAQLKNYIGLGSNYQLDSNLYFGHYVPEWHLGYLSDDWQSDYTNDLFHEMLYTSFSSVDFFSKQLQNLNEPLLYPTTNQLTFRITWLPSFDHPIVFRITMHEGKPTIFWKVGKGMGGYEPKGIKKEGKEEISTEEFNSIINLLDSTKLNSKYTYDYLPITDGASLIVEKSNQKEFKIHKTNSPDKNVTELMYQLSKKYFKRIKTGIKEY
jgi:hypothetical protein